MIRLERRVDVELHDDVRPGRRKQLEARVEGAHDGRPGKGAVGAGNRRDSDKFVSPFELSEDCGRRVRRSVVDDDPA